MPNKKVAILQDGKKVLNLTAENNSIHALVDYNFLRAIVKQLANVSVDEKRQSLIEKLAKIHYHNQYEDLIRTEFVFNESVRLIEHTNPAEELGDDEKSEEKIEYVA